MKKQHNHDGNEVKSKVEEFKMNLKRQIEDSSQAVKKIYRENIVSLYTTSSEITAMFHEMKTSLYKARNDGYPSSTQTINDVKLVRDMVKNRLLFVSLLISSLIFIICLLTVL